jgi:hypothetical protein
MDGFRLGLWWVVVSDAAAGRIECWKELQRILFQLSVRINNVCVCVYTIIFSVWAEVSSDLYGFFATS